MPHIHINASQRSSRQVVYYMPILTIFQCQPRLVGPQRFAPESKVIRIILWLDLALFRFRDVKAQIVVFRERNSVVPGRKAHPDLTTGIARTCPPH